MKFLTLISICLTLTFAACGSTGSDQTATSPVAALSGADELNEPGTKTASRYRRGSMMEMSKTEVAKLPPLAIPKPSGPPPRRLRVIDLRNGSGPVATKADVVSIRFIEDTYPKLLTVVRVG